MEKFKQKEAVSLSTACRLFGYSRQAYYKRKQMSSCYKELHSQVVDLVQAYRIKMPRLGTRKLYYLLAQEFAVHELKIGRDKLFAILRANHLLIRAKKSYHKTTDSKHWLKKHKNLLAETEVSKPEQLWVSDITYIATKQGHNYLSLVTDAYSKKIMGYHLAEDLKTEGPLLALKMALKNRKYKHALIHHSDRGLQYCSADYQQLLADAGIQPSMTESYDPYQNAVAERINGILKDEFLLDRDFQEHLQAVEVIKKSIQVYNELRPHLSCHYHTPEQMHQQQKMELKKWKKKTSKTVALEASI